jgi:hypothetical protein
MITYSHWIHRHRGIGRPPEPIKQSATAVRIPTGATTRGPATAKSAFAATFAAALGLEQTEISGDTNACS